MLEPTTVYTPSPNRYDSMTYNHAGESGLKLPAISLGFWHNFGDTTPYDTMGSFMAHMPYKVVLETFVIFLPLLFHALYGVYISLTSSVTVKRYRYFRNWCYVLQRIAGIVTLLFVTWHIYGTKLQVELTGVDPSYAMVAGIVATPIGLALFAIGLLCSIYHFCNGLWTFLITLSLIHISEPTRP